MSIPMNLAALYVASSLSRIRQIDAFPNDEALNDGAQLAEASPEVLGD